MAGRVTSELIDRKGFLPFDLRDGPVNESRVQLAGSPVIGVQPGPVLLRHADGVARALVENPPFRTLVYGAPVLPQSVLSALPGRRLSVLLDDALIATAGLEQDDLLRYVGLHSTPWDGPHAQLAERVVRTLEIELVRARA